MATLRPLGVGSQILTHGDKIAGFYGEVNGIITADKLRSMAGVTQGTPMQTGDITWLKFSHNYKTLFIAKQTIQAYISWDYLQSLDLIFGRMVEIGGSVYLLRLIQGANTSPSPGVEASNLDLGANNEWSNLISKIHKSGVWGLYEDSEINIGVAGVGNATWAQEVASENINNRVSLGIRGVNGFMHWNSGTKNGAQAWRPVLELLY
jgi:hypothetical protein